jgi:predicted DNA-binding protein
MRRESEKRLEKRYTVSFSTAQAEQLEELASRDAVTVSWVVRAAVDKYLRSLNPQMRLSFDGHMEARGHG